jgi:flagellar hook-length control protein FliK
MPTAAPTPAQAAAHPAGTPTAAEQLAPALLTLAKAADGSQQMTVRLHPADLGMVQVRIASAVSGATQIEITAQHPATLQALQRDQPQLHRTLDQAGIPAGGRTVTFHTEQAAQAMAAASSAPSSAGHAASQPHSPNRTQAGTTGSDGSGGGRASYKARERSAYPTSRRPNPAATPTNAKSYRIGLDITA